MIDFDAARMPKDGMESDTRQLGTRGYAPPEQYGFAQTDARTDIYSLGVTLEQIFGDKADKPQYRYIIQKCMKLDPDKRYQSVKQVEQAFFTEKGMFGAVRQRCFCFWQLFCGIRSDNGILPDSRH